MRTTFDLSTEDGRRDAEAFLVPDGTGGLSVPGGMFGDTSSECAATAVAVATILAHEGSDPVDEDGLEHVMGLVVNSSEDVAYLLVTYGPQYDIDPEDHFDVAAYFDSAAEDAGADAGRAAGSWVVDGNTDQATARAIVTMLDDGDPAFWDTFGPSAPLSGEWAGESIPELSDQYGIPLTHGGVAETFEQAFYTAFKDEVYRAASAMLDNGGAS